MRLTPALAIRNLIAKLHPPHPPTPRESQQLLSVLQNSFNRRLDDIHPSPQISAGPRNLDNTEHLPDVGNLSASAANAHLQSILNHPSLEQATRSSMNSPIKDAELKFDAAVIAQSVDFSLIRACIQMANSWDREEAALKLGPRISAWFTASSSATQRAFLCDSGLMSTVLPLMYQAKLENVVWDWLRHLYGGSAQLQQSLELMAEDRFIALMTRESIRRQDLRTAVLEYSEACEYRASRASSGAMREFRSRRPLIVTGNLVSSAILLRRHDHGIPAPLYDLLLSSAIPEPVNFETYLWPLLPLYHPSKAESRTLYQTLQNAGYVNGLMSKVETMTYDRATKLLINILDGADLMLIQGPKAKAQFILDFAQKHFPTMLPEKRSAEVGELIQRARKYVKSHRRPPPELVVT